MSRRGKRIPKRGAGSHIFAFTCFLLATILTIGVITALVYHKLTGSQVTSIIESPPINNTMQYESPVQSDDLAFAEIEQTVPQGTELATLQEQLSAYVADFDGRWSIYIINLTTREELSVTKNSEEGMPMVAASLIKIYIMGAVYEKVSAGVLTEEAIAEALMQMITVSDNAAANTLIELLGEGDATAGMAVVNDFATAFGCAGTSVNRLLLVEDGTQNYTTAKDCARLLAEIYYGNCVSYEYSTRMLALLSSQMRLNKIPAGLPAGIRSASKTGELSGFAESDIAIVFGPQADYVLCVLSEPISNRNAITAIKGISAMTYAFLNS